MKKDKFAGKKLLVLGSTSIGTYDIVKYAKNNGAYTIVADYIPDSSAKQIADESWLISTADVGQIIELSKKVKIDAVFAGVSEFNLEKALTISEELNLPFYTTREQWNTLTNKARFKSLLKAHGLPLIPEFSEDIDPETVDFPVIVKPVDGSGAKGIKVCRSANELKHAIEYAKGFSLSGSVIIEKFLEGMDDTFIRYHFQDGNYSVSSSFDRYLDYSKGEFTGMPILYTHPTKHLKTYMEKYDEKMQNLFKDIGIQNGVMTLQGFVDQDENFYFYETSNRLGGSQTYIFTDILNQSNSLEYMVNYAITEQMADFKIADRDNPWFHQACCHRYISLNGGVITAVEGLSEIWQLPGVLNISEMVPIGSEIVEDGSLNQVYLRMHLMTDSWKDMDMLLAQIDDTLHVLDENGNDMSMNHIRAISDVLPK